MNQRAKMTLKQQFMKSGLNCEFIRELSLE